MQWLGDTKPKGPKKGEKPDCQAERIKAVSLPVQAPREAA
jgi:hypothetical protein